MTAWILQKVRGFRVWWQGLNCFGQKLPVLLVFILFVALVVHILFEVSGTVCEAISIKCEGHRTAMKCGRDSFWEIFLKIVKKTTEVIVSDDVRNLGLLLAASIGWFFLYWRAKTADLNAEATEQSVTADKQSLLVEKLTRAMQQIAHKKVYVRIGGILGLEKIALSKDVDEAELEKIIHILLTFLHKNAAREKPEERPYKYSFPNRNERLDIEAAVKTLAKLSPSPLNDPLYQLKRISFDLQNLDLRGLHLSFINLSFFKLHYTDFTGAKLYEADLRGVQLQVANLSGADLTGANLDNAQLHDTNFTEAVLHAANLATAFLEGTDLTNAILYEADLSYASLKDSELSKANFLYADLTETNFLNAKNITQKQLKIIYYEKDKPPKHLPDELELPPQSDPPNKIKRNF